MMRDGGENRWRSDKLQEKRILALSKALRPNPTPKGGTCPKCGAGVLHPAGSPCIFGRYPNKKAKATARKVVEMLANGKVSPRELEQAVKEAGEERRKLEDKNNA